MPLPNEIEALLFDVFGTVVDWRGSMSRSLQEDGDISVEDAQAIADEWRAGYYRRTVEIASGKSGPTNIDVLFREILDDILASGRWPQHRIVDSWDESKRQKLTSKWHHLDGWADSSSGLYALKKKKVIGTLSNGSTRLLVDMAKHANLPWDVIFSGDLLGSYKPHPNMYLGSSRYLSLEPRKVAMVASHINDLRAAASHGMATVYVRRPTEDNGVRDTIKIKAEGGDADVVVDSLEELANLL